MSTALFIALWLGMGLVGSIVAVKVFRRENEMVPRHELYLAIFGPLAGPVTVVLLMLDILKSAVREHLSLLTRR